MKPHAKMVNAFQELAYATAVLIVLMVQMKALVDVRYLLYNLNIEKYKIFLCFLKLYMESEVFKKYYVINY
jgi:hypothetical protein